MILKGSAPLVLVGILLLLAAAGVGYFGWQSVVPQAQVQQEPDMAIDQAVASTTPSAPTSSVSIPSAPQPPSPYVTVLSPDGSISYSVRENVTISYCRPNPSLTDPIGFAHLYLMKGDTVISLIAATQTSGMKCPSTSIYSWKVGDFPSGLPNQISETDIQPGDNYRILVDYRDESGRSLAQSMSVPFTIKAAIQASSDQFAWCIDVRKYESLIQKSFQDRPAGLNAVPTTFIDGHAIVGALPWDIFRSAIEASLGNPEGEYPEPPKHLQEFSPSPVNSQDIILGSINAPVTIIEYGDYYSGFDAILFTKVEPLIREQYINTGKARLVFRNAPILGGGNSPAAEAAECARDQGQFWAYRSALFQEKFSSDQRDDAASLRFNREFFMEIAGSLDLR